MDTTLANPSAYVNPENAAADNMQEIKRELLDSKAQLRQVIDLIPEFIYARDYDGRFLLVNDMAAKYMDSTPEGLEGTRYGGLEVNNTVKYHHLEEDRMVIDSNAPLEIPLEKFTFSNNDVKYVRTMKVPFVTNSTHSKGVLCVSYDITRFITIGHLKDEYINQLEELAFATSHIVRQPLTSILGILQLMEYDAISPTDLKEVLSALKQQIGNFDTRTRELNSTINFFRSKINSFPG